MSRILAFDTSGPHCAAALLMNDAIYGASHLDMAKGQAEALMGLLEATLSAHDQTWNDLDAIAVGIGPGNFTGIRIGVSAARGLALALGVPAIGVSSFEIMRDPAGLRAYARELVSVPAPRGQAYVQSFRYGIAQDQPLLIDPSHAPEALRTINMRVRGYAAAEIAAQFDAETSEAQLQDYGSRIARVAELRLHDQSDPSQRPAPLYVKPPDAAPPKDPAPVILA